MLASAGARLRTRAQAAPQPGHPRPPGRRRRGVAGRGRPRRHLDAAGRHPRRGQPGRAVQALPTKDQLLAAAVEAMLRGFVEDFRRHIAVDLAGAARGPPPLDPGDLVAPACASLWRIFRRPEMRAVFEIYVAAHTDDALAARLVAHPRPPPRPDHDRGPPPVPGQRRPARLRGRDRRDRLRDAGRRARPVRAGPGRRRRRAPLAFLERLARRELGLDGARPPRAARARR